MLEQCLDPVCRTSIKTRNFVTFYEFLIHLGVHHTYQNNVTFYAYQPPPPPNDVAFDAYQLEDIAINAYQV